MRNDSTFKVVGLTKINEYWDDDPGQFLVQLHCEVTRTGDPGGEAFKVTVASPQQLGRELEAGDKVELGRGYMFMLDYDEEEIMSRLQKLLDTSRGASWPEIASFITKYFDWID